MRAAVPGVLAVDERGNVLAVAAAVGKDDLDIRSLDMDEGIQRFFRHVLRDEVQQAVLAHVGHPVQVEGEALLEVGVVLDHRLHDVHVEGVPLEHLVVGGEADEGAVLLPGLAEAAVQQDAAGVVREGTLAVAEGFHPEIGGHRVYGLGAHTVHAHGLLEGLGVEFSAGVELGGDVHDGAQRDAAPEVTHGHGLVFDGDVDALAETHRELVDGVVDDFLQQHVDAVSLPFAVAQAADIHTGAPPDVFIPLQGDDILFAVVGSFLFLCLFGHVTFFSLILQSYGFIPTISTCLLRRGGYFTCPTRNRFTSGRAGQLVVRVIMTTVSPLGRREVSRRTGMELFFCAGVSAGSV